MGVVDDYDDVEKMIHTEMEDLEQAKVKMEGEGGEKSLFGVADTRGDLKDGDNFLLGFIKNKRWVDKEEEEEAADDNTKGHDSDEYLNKVERIDDSEEKYSFRFEDKSVSLGPLSCASHSNVGYARGLLEDTLHRKDNSRSHNYTARKKRKAEERKANEVRLRRLNNARKEEMEGRLRKVQYILGESYEAAYAANEERGGE